MSRDRSGLCEGRAELQHLCTTQTHQLLAKQWRKISSSKVETFVAKKHLTAVTEAPGRQLSTAPCASHLPGKKMVLYQSFLQPPPCREPGEPTESSLPVVWGQYYAAFRDQHPQGLLRPGALVREAVVCASLAALAAAGLSTCPRNNECSS